MVAVVIVVVVAIVHAAALANFLELPAALLRLATVLAMFADFFLQILFRLVDITLTLVVAVGAGGHGGSRQQLCP